MDIITNYREVQRQLGKVDPALKKQVTKSMRALSLEVVADARVAAQWSAKIPAAIRPTSTATGAGVRVSGSVPIAKLNERRKPWRHPVFGDRNVWVSQNPRPSVRPVVDKKRVELRARGEEIVRDALREAGI